MTFNFLTGAVALLLLPWLVDWIEALREWLELDAAPATTLALFHTAFNLLGVLLMWPLANRMISTLQARFRSADEDEGRPHHLDANIASVPTLALDALILELRRVGVISLRMARTAIGTRAGAREALAHDKAVVERLTIAVGEFTARLHRATMTKESSERLPEILRVARYYDAVSDLAAQIASQHDTIGHTPRAVTGALARFNQESAQLSMLADTAREDFSIDACDAALSAFEEMYQMLKEELLRAGAEGALPVTQMEKILQVASLTRRAVQQAVKAAHRLHALDESVAGAIRLTEASHN